jgi:hypothetical protein
LIFIKNALLLLVEVAACGGSERAGCGLFLFTGIPVS